jgi:hypothetical protein
VSDCTLESPALHQHRAFIPWCLKSVSPPDSLLFYPHSSLESDYREASSVLWVRSTLASDAVHVERTHLQVLKLQGSAGLCAVVRAATAGAAGCREDAMGHACDCAGVGGDCGQRTAVTLLRLEVDTQNVDVLDAVLRGGSSSGSIGSCGVVVQQIIATFGVKLPYSSVLKGVDGEQNYTLAHRWPHAHVHCKECVRKEWLRQWLVEDLAHGLDVDQIESLLHLSARSFYVVAWRTLQFDRVEVTWMLRSIQPGTISKAESDAPYLDVSETGTVDKCLQDGVDTCGLSFCSYLQTPSECIGQPKLLAFVKRVLDVCARRWWAHERDHKEHCPGLRRHEITFERNAVMHKNILEDASGRLWMFALKVAHNPSLLKLISYGVWHHVWRVAPNVCTF